MHDTFKIGNEEKSFFNPINDINFNYSINDSLFVFLKKSSNSEELI